MSHGTRDPKSVASSQSQVAGSNFVPCFHHHTRHSSHGQPMAWTEHEFSDEVLRASLRAAAFTRTARGTAVTPRVAASSAGGEGGRAQGLVRHDRKRPRRNDENRGAGKARRRTAPATDETTRRLFDALNKSTSKPICEGGLAHYFVTEAHRRADMTKRPDPRAASALSIPAVFDAIAAASRQEGSRPAVGDCPVCLQDASGDSVALPCGHAFHKRCLVSWLQVNSSCPCCRAPVAPSEPYRYPTKTKLQNPLLRARVEGIELDMREVAMRTLHLEGMQGLAGLVLMRSPSEPLDPVGRPRV